MTAAPASEPVPAAPGPTTENSVVIRGLRKAYGDTIALDGLDLEARSGEILGVAGPNGAGKSTMIKILAAETSPDAGSIEVDGEPWSEQIGAHRIAVVHQEPQLFPNMTVSDNVMIGREGTRYLRRSITPRERAVMESLGILEFKDRLLGLVPLAVQQRAEIARALVLDARVFLFDEPNSALTDEESNDLFTRMEALAGEGRVVILVSHRLAELVEHADRVSVIRDGVCTSTLEGETLTQDAIAAELVVGASQRSTDDRAATEASGDVGLRLRDWTHDDGQFRGIDLSVETGQIVALVGVEGSGARELVRSIAGFERCSGSREIINASLRARSSTPGDSEAAATPSGASDAQGRPTAGRAETTGSDDSSFVSADRQLSLFANLAIGDNMISRLDREISTRLGTLRRADMKTIATELRTLFQVKTTSIDFPIRSLSGGNQQKVAIAAAIVKRPQVLVLEEPTRGVDIGSKAEIYALMRDYAGEGHAVVIFCTEVPEVYEVADLAYVVSDGRLSPPITVAEHEDVESLAKAVTRLERHASTTPAAKPDEAAA